MKTRPTYTIDLPCDDPFVPEPPHLKIRPGGNRFFVSYAEMRYLPKHRIWEWDVKTGTFTKEQAVEMRDKLTEMIEYMGGEDDLST